VHDELDGLVQQVRGERQQLRLSAPAAQLRRQRALQRRLDRRRLAHLEAHARHGGRHQQVLQVRCMQNAPVVSAAAVHACKLG
jgi:hypothetical protein